MGVGGSKKAIIIISSCTLIYFPRAQKRQANEWGGGETGVWEPAEQPPDMHAGGRISGAGT